MAAAGTVFMASDGKYPCRELGLMQPDVLVYTLHNRA